MPEQHAQATSQCIMTLLIYSAVLVVLEHVEFLHDIVLNPTGSEVQ